MIKLFRNIRQNLITENKKSKYFKYAIGEIILVVIGILIALQINNWNIERQNETIRKSFLVKLNAELEYNNNRLNGLSDMYNGILEQNLKLYDTLLEGLSLHNIETYLKAYTFNASRLNLSSSTFEQMKNTGNLHTLKSDTLLLTIETYYKLCEREDFYIMAINERVSDNTFDHINKGFRKAQLDYKAKGLNYALKNNTWLLNTQSKEYAEYIRESLITNDALNNILNRINRIGDTSNNLKELITKDLEKR
jgi:hypothetical protein